MVWQCCVLYGRKRATRTLSNFLNVYAPLFAPPRRMAEPTPFLPPPEIYSLLGNSIAITPSVTQELLLTPAERKYLTGSSLTSSPSMTLTHPPFSIAPLAVAPLLTSSLLPLLLHFLAPGRCFRTWVLTTDLLFYPFLSPAHRPNERPPSFNFQKARWDGFAPHFGGHCPSPEEYSSLSTAAALFTSLALNAAKSSISFGCIKRHPKAWWSAEVEEAVSERHKAFAAAHRSDEDCQAYISAYRRASSVIAKAEAWQTTCSSLSPKSNPKFVHSLLRSIAGSPSSSFSSPNFPSCSSVRKSASARFFCQQKALRSRARGYLSELRRATCPVESHSSFCFPFTPAEFLATASNLSSSTATDPDKVAYTMLKHLLALAWIFFFTFSIFPGLRIPFLPSGRHLLLFPSTRWESLSTLLLLSGLSLSPPAYQSCLNASFHPVYSSFWSLIPFSFPASPVSSLDGLL